MPMPNPPKDDGAQKGAQKPINLAVQKAMPTGTQVHDALMAPIDADLTTENLQTLDAKYAGETPDERRKRSDRYKLALQKYDIAFLAWVNGLNEKVNQYRQSVLAYAEKKSGQIDVDKMTNLESQISNLTGE